MTRLLGLLIAVTVSVPAAAQGYVRTIVPGNPKICLAWNRRSISYVIDAAGSAKTPGDTEAAAIDKAYASWQKVAAGCSEFTFKSGGRQAGVKVGQGTETSNVLVFREKNCDSRTVVPAGDPCIAAESCGNVYGCWSHGDRTIALTTTSYSRSTGVIVDADIEFNASPQTDGSPAFLFTAVDSPPCAPGVEATNCIVYDVQNTATHEIGHSIGLEHWLDGGFSTMAPSANPGDIDKRVVDTGSALGFCEIYPRGAPPPSCDPTGVVSQKIVARSNGTATPSCGAGIPAVAGLGVVASLASLRRRRSRRD